MIKKYTDMTIDLETLGLKSDANIVQIGACIFNLKDPTVEPILFLRNTICHASHYSVDQSTADWWNAQGEEAQKALQSPTPIKMRQAIIDLNRFFMDAKLIQRKIRVWAQGLDFDIPKIKHAYEIETQGKLTPPWVFWNQHDSRTLMSMFPNVKRVQSKIKHRADHDALAQSQTMMKIHEHIQRSQ
ncbi:MAG: 3'-5' exoribonuclease [Rhizobiales bacterium]|nr:3'-5' exoribonuclease [Hyphomicrobiales bacterium]